MDGIRSRDRMRRKIQEDQKMRGASWHDGEELVSEEGHREVLFDSMDRQTGREIQQIPDGGRR